MGIDILKNNVFGGTTGISIPSGSNIKIENNNFFNVDKAIEIREPSTLLGHLGLPHDTPHDLVIGLVRELIGITDTTNNRLTTTKVIEKSSLFQWLKDKLGVTANLATISSLFLDLQAQGALPKLLSYFGG